LTRNTTFRLMVRIRAYRSILAIPTKIVITSEIAITGVSLLVRLVAAEKDLNRRSLGVTTVERTFISRVPLSVSDRVVVSCIVIPKIVLGKGEGVVSVHVIAVLVERKVVAGEDKVS
jgi:hypothetical protein